MNALAENPRAVAGNNEAPDYAKEVTERMARDYAALQESLTEALADARTLPKEVNDDGVMGTVAHAVKRLRDVGDRIEAIRVAEKEPFLCGGNAVDSFFGALLAKIARKKKTDPVGAIDVLQARVDDYVNRKAAEERRRREEEARVAREAEEKARSAREAAERAQREAEEKAARARKQENIDLQRQAAREAEAAAQAAREAEERARRQEQDARAAATAKTADLVRTRTDEGNMVTAKQEGYVEVTDYAKLDAKILWDFIKDEHKLAALKQWAKITQHKRQMDGAIIGLRDKAVIR